jgi:hypothetical protein
MNDFLANKIIDDFILGNMTAKEVWANLTESRDTISDEKYDEITALIIEQLLEAEIIEEEIEEVNLDELFQDNDLIQIDDQWEDYYYEGDWPFDDPKSQQGD